MADENGTQQQTPKTFTQEEVNEMMGKVRRETREKYADYDELSKKAKAYDEAQEAAKTELEKAQEAAAKAKAEADALKAEKARADLVAKVAKETGVPASLITGDDEDSMREYAKRLAEWRKPKGAPKVGNAGSFDRGDGSKGGDDGRRVLARKMFGSDE